MWFKTRKTEVMPVRIKELILKNFMLFENVEIDWSNNINIICGENSTGKTTLLKVMYSILKPLGKDYQEAMTKEMEEKLFVGKLQGVFRPDQMKIGRLVSRKRGSNRTDFKVVLDKNRELSIGFGTRNGNHADIKTRNMHAIDKYDVIYIPTKEMISTTEHFAALYEDYHIDFEEMYYDLAKLLDRPLSKGPNTKEQNDVLKSFEKIMKGQIVQRDRKFYLKVKGQGEFEMGLLSDGYRKLSMIVYLILSGSLNKDAILFWDEPETNMNPKMIYPIVQALTTLAKMGVQIFVTTHDYFVQQEFNMMTVYSDLNPAQLDIRFMSLYRDDIDGEVHCEMAQTASELKHNAIMQEFDAMYDREQEMIYAD